METKDLILLFIFGMITLIGARAFLEVMLYSSFRGHGYRSYRKQVHRIDRYFMISAQKLIKDRYSKEERRTIRYSAVVQVLFVLNLLLCVTLLSMIVFGILHLAAVVTAELLSAVCLASLIVALFVFFVCGIIEGSVDRNYHKKRTRRQ